MVLGIDVSRANRCDRTGVEWYAFKIVEALTKELASAPVRLYAPEPATQEWPELPASWQWCILPGRHFWTQSMLADHLRRFPVDCVFIPSSRLPPNCGARIITTIHDIAFKTHPNAYPWKERFLQDWALKDAIRRADALIVPTQSVRQDLALRHPQIEANKIHVIPHGPTMAPVPYTPKTSNSFLFVGRLEKKKNLVPLIESIERIAHQPGASSIRLTLVGKPGYGFHKLKSLLNQCRDHIQWLGWVGEDRLHALRQDAQFTVLPSSAEGFGFPVLEAWAVGSVPIISDCAALVEVAGDAAVVLPLKDPKHWDAILKKSMSEDLKEIINRGSQRLQQFQWSTAGHQTAEIVKRFL